MSLTDVPWKALIIDSPHIERILAGEKIWEMRSRNCLFRGAIGLIRKGSGKVVGLAELVSVRGPLSRSELLANRDKHRRTAEQVDDPKLAKWNIAWILSDARPLKAPVPYVHRKGAVTWVTLDDDVRAQIGAQTGLKVLPANPAKRARTAKRQRHSNGSESEDPSSTGTRVAVILVIGGLLLLVNFASIGAFIAIAVVISVMLLVIESGLTRALIAILRAIPGILIVFYLLIFLFGR